MTASSSWDKNHSPWLARLHRARRGRLVGAWASRHKNHNQWLQVDLGRSMKVTGINTQGRQDADQWVTAYYIRYSLDGAHFSSVREWWDTIKVRPGYLWPDYNSHVSNIRLCLVYLKLTRVEGKVCSQDMKLT